MSPLLVLKPPSVDETDENAATGTQCPREGLLRSLYAEHGAALLSFAKRLTYPDNQWAEDVVQETLLRAWRTSVDVDDSKPPVRSWLFTVARRVVIDGHRSRAARPKEVGDGDGILEFMAGADQIDDVLSSLAVADAVASLSQAHREVLHEIYFRGSKVNEAAETLGLLPGTVKSRAHYALRALKLALEERGISGRM
jgi:RNA polymerase sigma-70 factor (ECF subfamily)